MGYAASEPQFNEYSSGKCKASFSIGINYGKETTWIDVECWDKIAENCNSFVKKGSLVFIEGKMKFSSWKTKKGESRSKLFCVCDFIKILNNKESSLKEDDEIESIHKLRDIKNINPEIKTSQELLSEEELEEEPW